MEIVTALRGKESGISGQGFRVKREEPAHQGSRFVHSAFTSLCI